MYFELESPLSDCPTFLLGSNPGLSEGVCQYKKTAEVSEIWWLSADNLFDIPGNPGGCQELPVLGVNFYDKSIGHLLFTNPDISQ